LTGLQQWKIAPSTAKGETSLSKQDAWRNTARTRKAGPHGPPAGKNMDFSGLMEGPVLAGGQYRPPAGV